VGGAAALPAEALRALDLDGSVQIGALTAGGARLAEFRAHWRAAAGAVTQTAEARLYGGSARATSTLDLNPAPPAMTLEGALQDVDLRGLLADTARWSRLSGTASIDADLRWRGLSEAELKGSLDGRARVAVRDGAVQGFDLDGLVRKALAAVQGGRPAEVAGVTAFSELTATLTARDGVLSNRDLRATSALLSLTGAGTIDLAADRIDYLAKAMVREPALGPLGDRLAELRDTPIPVRVTGSLAAPSVTLDVAEVLRSQAGRSIQRKVEEKLKGEWGDKLKKFLDR
jgi:AsmA protein